jgi:hypothetical protein
MSTDESLCAAVDDVGADKHVVRHGIGFQKVCGLMRGRSYDNSSEYSKDAARHAHPLIKVNRVDPCWLDAAVMLQDQCGCLESCPCKVWASVRQVEGSKTLHYINLHK